MAELGVSSCPVVWKEFGERGHTGKGVLQPQARRQLKVHPEERFFTSGLQEWCKVTLHVGSSVGAVIDHRNRTALRKYKKHRPTPSRLATPAANKSSQ